MFDKNEATNLLENEVDFERKKPYAYFLQLAETRNEEIRSVGGSKTDYIITVEAFFEDKKEKTVRVLLNIDEKGAASFVPMSRDFIMAPDGTFVGE